MEVAVLLAIFSDICQTPRQKLLQGMSLRLQARTTRGHICCSALAWAECSFQGPASNLAQGVPPSRDAVLVVLETLRATSRPSSSASPVWDARDYRFKISAS